MKNNYPPLIKTNHEPEYKTSPPLEISSVSTEIKKNSQEMPAGSALLTNAGLSIGSYLNMQGIEYIIHAAPRHRNEFSSEEKFIEVAVKAAQNSIILADQQTIDRLAMCFIAGKIYRGSCEPNKLAKAIIIGSLNQMEKCTNLKEIIFVAYKDQSKGQDEPYLVNAFDEIKADPNYSAKAKKGKVKRGDICNRSLHGARAIVNSENTQMIWGGGISGAIKEKLGTDADKVDEQRKDLIKKFNHIINQNPDQDDNLSKISFQARYGCGGNLTNNSGMPYYLFWIEGEKNGYFQIDPEHPIFKRITHFWNVPENNNQYLPVKITIEKAKKDEEKTTIEKDDFIEIEQIKNDDKNKDNKSAAEWQEELKKFDDNIGQIFDENKVKEWKKQGNIGKVEKVKKLFEEVKNNSQFLNLIKTKQSSSNLKELVSNKSPSDVITIIKRFEYDNLSQLDKEIKVKRMRKHYNLGENDTLNDNQINEYCYKLAVGQINENEQDQNTTNPENNVLKYFGISVLTLIPLGLLLAFFIRKRKK